MALTNRVALIQYDVAGPTINHERLILDHIEQDDYIICTPDRDIYAETMSPLNPDLRAFRVRPRPNRLPPGVVAAEVYGLPNWSAAELNAIKADAAAEAVAERRRRNIGGPGGGAAPAAVAAPVAAVSPAAPLTAASAGEPRAPGAVDVAGDQGVWVYAESDCGVVFGDRAQGVQDAPVIGDKIIHVLANGKKVFCICVGEKTVDDFNNRPAMCDGRILARKKNALGLPEMTLNDVSAQSKQYELGWKIVGPKTSKWCLAYLAVEGLGLEGHHERFRQLCKLETSSWGVMEHFQISMFVKHLLQTDMINACNSQGIELMFRRLQTIEYAHSEKAREAESKATGGKLSLEEQASFGSVVRQSGTLMISPDLLSHVKEEVERDAALQKNLRKAREERELARKQNKGKKNEEGP